MSSEHALPTASAREYAAAYATHYTERDLPAALLAYGDLMTQHPTALEAEYSRVQLHNIVRSVVPAAELLDLEIKLAREVLQRPRV